ncbi:MAG: exo-alpha-sialidase [Anaerolineae bacterium]|nr:exo-alpha-sialidase [Anaerolineae bacterium]
MERPMVIADATHAVVAYDAAKWAAVPANNGGNSPTWQWGEELLVGFTMGAFASPDSLHQTVNAGPFVSWLARSRDGGESWETTAPTPYAGQAGVPARAPGGVDFTASGFVLRVEGNGYHGNAGAQWFASWDRGATWRGPFGFGDLLEHPELEGMEFTARTGYLVNGPRDLFLFLSARRPFSGDHLQVRLTDKSFLARTTDGGRVFAFVSWVVGRDDPYRAVMPAPVRLSATEMVVALRRKSADHNWIDVYGSADSGQSWVFVSKVGDTEEGNSYNGNPPAMVRTRDGRLCCVYGNRSRRRIIARISADKGRTWGPEHVVRQGFRSVNGRPDLGYPRLFSRPDGKLVAVYFWCTPERPQTHIEATIFAMPVV